MDNFLERVVYISSTLVVLQTLRWGYRLEIESENKQEIKNFRSAALLAEMRGILESLEEHMIYLAEYEKRGKVDIKLIEEDSIKHVTDLIKNLTDIYGWTIEEVRLKEERARLIKTEREWKE